MTDNDIIKALDMCSDENAGCSECPYSDDYTICNERIAKDALDLINRQKAEIESLNEQERILICQLAEERDKAIKEFAEKLKTELTTGSAVMRVSTIDCIDNLVKEMVGD